MANPEHIEWLLEGVESWNQKRMHEGFIPVLNGEDIASKFRDAQIVTGRGKPNLGFVNLSKASLNGCNFSDTYLFGADLSGARLSGARFGQALMFRTDLTQAELQDADLTGAVLRGADFGQANLTNCKLKCAKIADANLVGANLTGSRLWKASMRASASHQWDYSRSHLSGNVTGINDLLQFIRRLESNYAPEDQKDTTVFYFRGESRYTWTLAPGVMRRSPANENSLRAAEGEMLVDLRSRRAEDFAEANSALDQMVVAQHHGLPTRLLDVTRNPLVALFHASEVWNESRSVNGRIHVFAVPRFLVKPFNSDTVSVIANFARLRRGEQNILLSKTKEDTKCDTDPGFGPEFQLGDSYALAMNRLYQFIRLEKPSFKERIDPKDLFRVIVVEPQQSFERIRAQSGAFLLSAFHERFEETEVLKWTADLPLYHHYTLTVRGGCKSAIDAELATFNITRETMFPGLDEAAKAVTDFYRRP